MAEDAGVDGVTDEGFVQLIRRRVGHSKVRAACSKRPEFHLLGRFRYAVVKSPCCGRRLRVRIVSRARKWVAENAKTCPFCRRIWRIEARLTNRGIARAVRFFYPAGAPKIVHLDAS